MSDWYIPGTPDDSTNKIALDRDIVPVLYGRRRISGKLVYANVIDDKLHLLHIFSEGEIDAFETVYINGEEASYYGAIVNVETYTGTLTQSVCGLSAYDINFNDRLAGTAYIYTRITQSSYIQDLPAVEAVARGRKLYDPRTAQTVYSTNPALALADMLINKRYGGRLADSPAVGLATIFSIEDAADRCDELLGTPPDQQKRFEFSYYFDSSITLASAIDIIKLHFLGFITNSDGTYDKYLFGFWQPSSSVTSFSDTDVITGSISFEPIGSEDMINVVKYSWTETDKWTTVQEVMEAPDLSGTDEVHEASYDLTGCLSKSQADRIATFLLNSRLADLKVVFKTHNPKGLQAYDVFDFTHAIGLSAKEFYATYVSQSPTDGLWTIKGREYDPGFFSDEIQTEPTYPDTNLPSPTATPTNATNLELEEQLMQLKDSTWISVINMSWTASTWLFVKHYEVWARQDTGDYLMLGTITGTTYELRAPQELSTYTIKVITVSHYNRKSGGIESSIIPQGKYIPPTWKTGAILTGTEAGNVVFLRWAMPDGTEPHIDIDIVTFELKRGMVTDVWDSAVALCHLDALVFNDSQCPAGTWRYFLKARDSVGNYTATALSCDVTVTLNPGIGFQNTEYIDLQGSSLTNAYILRIDNAGTDIGYPSSGLTWAQRFDLAKAWDDPLQTYLPADYPYWITPAPVSGASIITAAVDFGAVISGKWSIYYSVIKLGSGTPALALKILLSDDNLNWTEYDASGIVAASARYVKAKFIFSSNTDKALYIVQEPVYIVLNADSKEDSGLETVTGGTAAIVFQTVFNEIKKVSLTPVFAGDALDPRQAVPDALTAAGMDIKLFDKNNTAAAGSVYWKVEGY